MARKKKRKRSVMNKSSGFDMTIHSGFYEGKNVHVPNGFIKFTNPQKKKLSRLV